MTTRLRLLLCLLLCLALPVNALAALAVTQEPCPMAAEHQDMAMDQAHDCCDEQSGAPGGAGKLCKSGHQCQGSSLLQAAIGKPPLSMAVAALPTSHSEFMSSPTAEGLWRPPRA